MTVIKASCPDDGEVQLGPDDIDLMVCTIPEWSYYAFICPKCTKMVKKKADLQVVRLLKSGGVEPQVWVVPNEATEIANMRGDPFTLDDLLTFHELLENDDYFPQGGDQAG